LGLGELIVRRCLLVLFVPFDLLDFVFASASASWLFFGVGELLTAQLDLSVHVTCMILGLR